MFLAVHASVGALAGNAIGHPAAALLFGVVSHFFLDMIPHGDDAFYRIYFVEGRGQRRIKIYAAADIVLTAALIPLFFLQRDFFSPVSVALGIAGSLLPDLLVGLSILFPPRRAAGFFWRLDRFKAFHRWNHALLIGRFSRMKRDIPLISGLILQTIALCALVVVIL